MTKNNNQYWPRIAGTTIDLHELTTCLIDELDTAGYDLACPFLVSGPCDSIQITLLYLRGAIPQRVLALFYHTSQPTISRAINAVVDALDTVLAEPPTPEELDPDRYLVADGTVVPCYSWHDAPELV